MKAKTALFLTFFCALLLTNCAGGGGGTLTPVNNPPVFSPLPDLTVEVDHMVQLLDLSSYVKDESVATLQFKITSQSNLDAVECYLLGPLLTSKIAHMEGINNVSIKVTDEGGLSATAIVKIIVKAPPNNPPAFSLLPDLTVEVGHEINLLHLSPYVNDEDVITLRYEITSQSNPGAVECYLFDAFLESKPAEAEGINNVSIKVTDKGGLSATATVKITVTAPPPVNEPPVIAQMPEITVVVGEVIKQLSLPTYVTDEDPATLRYELVAQTNPDAVECYLEDTSLKSNAAQKTGDNTVTIKVTDKGGLSATATVKITVKAPPVACKVYGLNFSPYMDGQDPNYGAVVSEEQIRERLGIITPYTTWIRTFGSTQGLENVGPIAREFSLKTALGAWIGRDTSANELELMNLIEAAKGGYADIAVVGSEVLLRGDLSEDRLIEYINRFRAEVPTVPVTTGEVYGALLNHPNLVNACDLVFVNYYPYWEGKNITSAVAFVHAMNQMIKSKYGSKEIIISETGWPSDGDTIGEAVPTLENASFYFLNFVSWAKAEHYGYFHFEAFDESWKAAYEGPQGAAWGVWDKDGNLKPGMMDVFDGKTVPDNWTCQAPPGGAGVPAIEFTYVPPKGSFDNLKGQVWHVTPSDYRVAVYIRVGGGWWTKPYWDTPLTVIDCDGIWTCDITTGGYDSQADMITAYLVPVNYNVPLARGEPTLPAELDVNAVAKVEVTR
jgi:exo-beta-1,3-glucanase (GH17 family)